MHPPETFVRPRSDHLPVEVQDRLLRAVADLRRLERERQEQRAAHRPAEDLARRLEAAAREIFRLGREADARGDGRT
jgi:hypothetical protein